MRCAKKLLWRTLKDDLPALVAPFRSHINDPIGVLDDIQIMLDHDHGVACIHQPVDDLQQMTNIRHVQASGRLVHNINTAFLVQLSGELDALAFATR